MTDDLTTQQMLRDAREAVRLNEREMRDLLGRMADRIEALEADLARWWGAAHSTMAALAARETVVAEALAVPAYWTPNGATDGVRRAEHMRSILAATGEEYVYAPGGPSRVPQGAAEPNQHICFSGCRCGGQGTTVAWTDPKPFRQREGTVRSDMTLPWVHDPRSREQYDAEEGNRG